MARLTYDVALLIAPRGCVQKYLQPDPRLRHKREFKVSSLLAMKGLVEDSLNCRLEFIRDKFLHEVLKVREKI